MLKTIKSWWRNLVKDEELQSQFAQLSKTSSEMFEALKNIQHEKQMIERENNDMKQELVVLRQAAEKAQARYDSNEPWIEIVSDSFDENKGLQISLDWNNAFIEHLKENGYQGANDEDVIRLYLAFLYRDIVERMEANAEADLDRKTRRQRINDE